MHLRLLFYPLLQGSVHKEYQKNKKKNNKQKFNERRERNSLCCVHNCHELLLRCWERPVRQPSSWMCAHQMHSLRLPLLLSLHPSLWGCSASVGFSEAPAHLCCSIWTWSYSYLSTVTFLFQSSGMSHSMPSSGMPKTCQSSPKNDTLQSSQSCVSPFGIANV